MPTFLDAAGLSKLLQKIKTVFATKTELSSAVDDIASTSGSTGSSLVHRSGSETIAGTKTFSSTISGTADKALKDGSGNTIASYYCTLGTDQEVSGIKDFTNNLYVKMLAPQICFTHTDFTKGTNPGTTRWAGLHFTDKTEHSIGTAVRLANLESNVSTAGQTALYVRAYNWVASNTTNAYIGVIYPKNGTPYAETTALFRPTGNGTVTCGDGSHRWKSVYAATSTIQTSDERLKEGIEAIPDSVLDAWENVQWRQFRMKDAVEEKGENARIHAGIIAQHVAESFREHSVNPDAYGFYCYDEWEASEARLDSDGNVDVEAMPAGNQYSIRYEEALAIEAAYQRRRADRMERRIAELEDRLAKLEAKGE